MQSPAFNPTFAARVPYSNPVIKTPFPLFAPKKFASCDVRFSTRTPSWPRAGPIWKLKDLGKLMGGILNKMPPINFPRSFNFQMGPARGQLGVRVENLTSQLADYFGVKQGKGVLITEVESGTPAAKVGLKAGDCIVKAGSKDVQSVMDLTEALDSAGDRNQPVTLTIIRKGQEESFKVELEHPLQSPPEQQVREWQRRLRQPIHAPALEKELEALQGWEA